MDVATGIRDFLSSRRARIKPEDVGMPPGGRRRVPGLRREEVAQLAGVSTEYYVQIERGKVAGVSDDVLRAVATALRLTGDEVAHFFDLVRAATSDYRGERGKHATEQAIPDGLQALMDSMAGSPAIVIN